MTQTQIPAFTHRAIANRIDARSLSRGRVYARNGAVVSTQVQGRILKAQCFGSQSAPYRVSAEFNDHTITDASCSCPVGSGGACKHVAALLFAWLNDSSQFVITQPLQESLEGRTKAQLIDLIRRIVKRHPHLEDIVVLTPTSATKIDPVLIRKQVQAALREAEYSDDYYHAASQAADSILESAEQATALLADDNWQAVATIYKVLAEETLPFIDQLHDHDGDLYRVFYACSEQFEKCLEYLSDPAERESILRSLYDIILADISAGGYGFSDMSYAPLTQKSTSAEKETVAQWARNAQRQGSSSKWRNQGLGGLILRLTEDSISDDDYIALTLKSERYSDAVKRMLEVGRLDSAEKVAQTVGDYELVMLANLFLENGYGERIEPLVLKRTATSNDTRLNIWLQKYAESINDWESAIKYCEARFGVRPSLPRYEDLQRVAEQHGSWQTVRGKTINRLELNNEWTLLIDIALAEKQPEQAFMYLNRLHTHKNRFGHVRFDQQRAVKVAHAIETVQPQLAINLYCTVVDKLIAQRGRDNYKTAAGLLQRVKTTSLANGQQAQWQKLITRLRMENRKLRAMKDEFARAGI